MKALTLLYFHNLRQELRETKPLGRINKPKLSDYLPASRSGNLAVGQKSVQLLWFGSGRPLHHDDVGAAN